MPKLYIQPFFLPRYDSLISNFSSQFQYLIHQMSNYNQQTSERKLLSRFLVKITWETYFSQKGE